MEAKRHIVRITCTDNVTRFYYCPTRVSTDNALHDAVAFARRHSLPAAGYYITGAVA